MGLDGDVAADLRYRRKNHGLGRHQGHALQHEAAPVALLEGPLDRGQLNPVIDAGHFVFRAFGMANAGALGGRQFDQVGEIVFALGIVA